MSDDSKKIVGDSSQPKSANESFQPKMVEEKKSLTPKVPETRPGESGVGASQQPKAPLETQQAKPPPGED